MQKLVKISGRTLYTFFVCTTILRLYIENTYESLCDIEYDPLLKE